MDPHDAYNTFMFIIMTLGALSLSAALVGAFLVLKFLFKKRG